MKRSTRLAFSGLVLLASACLGVMAAILAARMIPGYEIEPGIIEGTPITLLGAGAAFVAVAGVGLVFGLLYVWDRRFD